MQLPKPCITLVVEIFPAHFTLLHVITYTRVIQQPVHLSSHRGVVFDKYTHSQHRSQRLCMVSQLCFFYCIFAFNFNHQLLWRAKEWDTIVTLSALFPLSLVIVTHFPGCCTCGSAFLFFSSEFTQNCPAVTQRERERRILKSITRLHIKLMLSPLAWTELWHVGSHSPSF